MAGSRLNLFGLICAAALVALPTMQAASTSRDASFVAIAPVHSAPADEPLSQQVATGAGGPSADLGAALLDPPGFTEGAGQAAADLAAAEIPVEPDAARWLWPTPSKLITSPFGFRSDPLTGGAAFHSGIDFGDPCGTPVGATRPGRVTFTGAAGGYGYRVVVDHGEGIQSTYSHLQQVMVQVGDEATQSNAVGLVGTTGRSTGCHLHFEIIVNGGFTDPLPYLTGNPAANPTTFGQGSTPGEPTDEASESPSPTPSPSQVPDPCQITVDPEDAEESGGLVPIEGELPDDCQPPDATPRPTPSQTPDPSQTPHPSATPEPGQTPDPGGTPSGSGTPSPDPSGSTTPTASKPGEPEPSTTPQPSTPLAPTPSGSSTPSPSQAPEPPASQPTTASEQPTGLETPQPSASTVATEPGLAMVDEELVEAPVV
ncbi:MAG: peptidoglycan DD-metalloendopeptidase family protein [Brooklawnia sp.]|uniref:M23 family metallopeptidase n=1 Tax=Brooklawnia sp. TaxID=2699740 RepID=UPI003C7531D0